MRMVVSKNLADKANLKLNANGEVELTPQQQFVMDAMGEILAKDPAFQANIAKAGAAMKARMDHDFSQDDCKIGYTKR